MNDLTARTGIVLSGNQVLGMSLRGLHAGRAVATHWMPSDPITPAELVRVLTASRREYPEAHGQLRVVLPAELCENYLRVFKDPLGADALALQVTRWLQDPAGAGIDTETRDLHITPYTFQGTQVAVATLTEPGLLPEYRREIAAAGIANVVLLSPLDAMIHLAQTVQADALQERTALCHVGRTHSLVLVLEDYVPVFYRAFARRVEVEAASDRYEQIKPGSAPASVVTPESAEALARELNQTLSSHARATGRRAHDTGQIVLTASGLAVRLLAPLVERHTGATAGVAAPVHTPAPEVLDADALREAWPQLALPAAVASPLRLPAAARLVHLPGLVARVCAPRSVAVAALCLYVLLLAAIWGYLARRGGRLDEVGRGLERQRMGLQSKVNQRRQDHATRQAYLAMVDLLLRMKSQGRVAAAMLASANRVRPSQVTFDEITLDAEQNVYRIEMKGSLPESSPRDALHLLRRYAGQLRTTKVFDRVAEPELRTEEETVQPPPQAVEQTLRDVPRTRRRERRTYTHDRFRRRWLSGDRRNAMERAREAEWRQRILQQLRQREARARVDEQTRAGGQTQAAAAAARVIRRQVYSLRAETKPPWHREKRQDLE